MNEVSIEGQSSYHFNSQNSETNIVGDNLVQPSLVAIPMSSSTLQKKNNYPFFTNEYFMNL